MQITLVNELHGTSCRIRPWVDKRGYLQITDDTLKRVKEKLCGSIYCNCGTVIGGEWTIDRFSGPFTYDVWKREDL